MHALSQAGALPSVPGFCSGIDAYTVAPARAVTSLCPLGRHLHPAWHTGHEAQSPTVTAIPEERH